MIRFFLFCLLTFSSLSFATMTITYVDGVSGQAGVNGVAGQAVTLYAGMAGTGCTTPGCNSCAFCSGTPALCACNTARIGRLSPVTIKFRTDYNQVTTTTLISITDTTGNVVKSYGGYSGANAEQTISTVWDDLCNAGYGTDCETAAASGTSQKVIRIGISNNSSIADWVNVTISVLAPSVDLVDNAASTAGSLYSWRAYPGDEVVYIKDPFGDAGFPGSTTGIRVFVSNVDFAHAIPGLAIKSQDFTLSTDGQLSDNIIDGLDNDPATPYYFRIAALDAAKNVYGFTSDANITDPTGGACTSAVAPADTDTTGPCRYIAKPDQVLGILSKDMNCFIATASYGSSLEPKINAFREFRSRYLLLNKYGRQFVDGYYHWGPYAARWIADREWARTVSRGILWPLYGYASLANSMGIEKASLIFLMGLVLLIASFVAVVSKIQESRESN